MSFLDRQGIPEALVRSRAEVKTSEQHAQKKDTRGFRHLRRLFHRDKDCHKCRQKNYRESEGQNNKNSESVGGFEDDLLMLRNYSFVSVTVDQSTFEMHRLVQLATRKWLETHGTLERWNQQFIRNLCAKFPTGEHENWATCQTLFPHTKSAAMQQLKGEESLAEWTSLLYHAAWYGWHMGSMADAEELAMKSLKARKKVFGPEHQDTLISTHILALTYRNRGRWGEAEELQVRVLETLKRLFGLEHPQTLISMNQLA